MGLTLGALPRNQGKNPTGYKKLYFTDITNVTAIAAATAHVVSADLTMDGAAVFEEIQFDDEAGAWLSTDEPDANGTTGHVYNVTAFLAGNSSALKAAVDAIDGVSLALIGETKDGKYELLFEVDRGIRLRVVGENNGKPGSRRGYLLQGSNDFNNLPYEYTGTIATS